MERGCFRKNSTLIFVAFLATAVIFLTVLFLRHPLDGLPIYSEHSEAAQVSSEAIHDVSLERQPHFTTGFADRSRGGGFSLGVVCVLFALIALLTKFCVDAYCRLAIKVGLVSRPDANRRLHKEPIPLGGGVVVFLMTLITLVGISTFADESVSISALVSSKIIFPLLVSATILVCVGLADDKWELSGRAKLLSQIVVATIVIIFAKEFSTISVFGAEIELGHMFYPLGVLWLVGIINAVNFLDGADGVASTAGIFMSLTVGAFAVITGQTTILIISVVFAGALLGFLFCNFPPAKVYLGDAGSTLIGLVTGVLIIRACTVEDRVIHILPPLAVAIIPVFDAFLSFYRRMSSGRGLFSPDRAHIHHRFLLIFQCNQKILRCFSLFFLLGGCVACLGMYHRNDWFSLAAVMMIPCVLIFTGLFGKEEMRTLLERFRYEWKKRMHKKNDEDDLGMMLRFQGNGPWDELWQELVTTIKSVSCHKVSLDVNIPFLHESFIGRWDNPDVQTHDKILVYYIIPLFYDNQKVGTLVISLSVDKRKDRSDADNQRDIMKNFADEISELCIRQIADYVNTEKHIGTETETIPNQSQPLTASPEETEPQETTVLETNFDRTHDDWNIFESSKK